MNNLPRTTRQRHSGYRALFPFMFAAFVLASCSGGGGQNTWTGTGGSGGGGGGGGGGGDTTRPVVAITSPTPGPSYTAGGPMLDLGGTASDDTGVTQVTWSNNRGGSGTASGSTNWTATGIALQTGTNTITVTAHDAATNTASASLVVSFNAGPAATYFISPTGRDSNDGLTPTTPWKTFAKAFSTMAGGDELILLDGTYSQAAGTGYISHLGTNSAQPPSGSSLTAMTYIHALNPGNVRVVGNSSGDYERVALFIGRNNASGKSRFIRVEGITFEGGGWLYNADYTTIKDSGFHGAFGIGTNDHDQDNNNNLIEDVWIWASGERIIAINYRAHNNVWRRVVVRGDGCGTDSCRGSGNPNVGITIYNSRNISFQNVMVVDRILAPTDEHYGDFASAQHNNPTNDPAYYFGGNEWLGTISIRSPDSGYYIEPDTTIDPTAKISNAVAFDSADLGFNITRSGTSNLLENLTVYSSRFDGIRVAPELTTGVLRNAIVANAGTIGISSKYTPSHVNVFGSGQSAYDQTTCSESCFTSNPQADTPGPSLKFLTRIETGSKLKGAGFGGTDIGANILFRYGPDGSRSGETDYNALTAVPLWPWPNEARIKREMCVDSGVTRGFCSTGTRLDGVSPVTLTSYIWEALSSPIPPGIYP